MKTILISSLSVHWAVVFALASAQAIGLGAVEGSAAGAVLATAHALVAALFAWSAACAWGCTGRGVGDVARLAFAAAAVTLAAVAVLEGRVAAEFVMLQLAALGVTYLVIRSETVASEGREAPDHSLAVARRLAAGAAHCSMLTRLSGRGAGPAESEA